MARLADADSETLERGESVAFDGGERFEVIDRLGSGGFEKGGLVFGLDADCVCRVDELADLESHARVLRHVSRPALLCAVLRGNIELAVHLETERRHGVGGIRSALDCNRHVLVRKGPVRRVGRLHR